MMILLAFFVDNLLRCIYTHGVREGVYLEGSVLCPRGFIGLIFLIDNGETRKHRAEGFDN